MTETGHHHPHPHPHPTAPDRDGPPSYYQALEIAVRELLIGKGVFTADDVRRAVEAMDARTPAQGARVVARAWTDPAYKARLLADGTAAVRELGIDTLTARLIVVENRPACTISSSARSAPAIRARCWACRPTGTRAAPIAAAPCASRARCCGNSAPSPPEVELRVHDSTADMRYLVLPERPAGTEGWSEERLAALVTRDSMIGVTRCRA